MSKTITTGWISDKINGIAVTQSACSSQNYAACASRAVSYIVIHYTGNSSDTAAANCNYFKTGGRGASAHFFADDTHIMQSVKLKDRAWHVGANSYKHKTCRNTNSIGIEMCTSGSYKVSAKTKQNAAYLCAYLCRLLSITAGQVDTYVLRHWDVTGKNCPAQMAGNGNVEWTAFKAEVKSILNGKPNASNSAPVSASSFKVQVSISNLNIRKGPGTNYAKTGKKTGKGVFTITETKSGTGSKAGWGKLKSGAGWISLDYCTRV